MQTAATTEPRRTQRIRSLSRTGCTCATKESLGPGITRIRGNLCNVHGKYGPCDASASGKKPGKGAAKKPKQTPEQRATARAQQRQANIDSVAQRMADSDTGIAPAGAAALVAFADGTPPDAQTGAQLAKLGLAEQAADGSYRMTPTGRATVSAMEAGDYQRAVDTISRGTDASSRRQERTTAAQARQQATAQRKQEVAQRRADAQAKRAAREAERAQAKPKAPKQAAPAKAPASPTRRQQRRVSRGASSGGGGSAGGSSSSTATPKPKAPTAPPVEKPAKPTIAPELTAAASKLSAGETLTEAEQLSLVRNGLARQDKDGALILTASGLRATQKEKHWTAAHRAIAAWEQSMAQAESFTVFKDTSGADRWLSISSTAYRDRDREIVSTKALDGAVALADASGYRGPLRYWHVPGADLGDCDYQATMQDGRFLIESGTFRSPELAAAVKAHAGEYRMSIGFTHPPDQPDSHGVFSDIAIFERSLVPAGRESNPFTQLTTTKEQRMLTDEKAAGLRTLLDGNEGLLQGLLGQVAQTDKAAQAGGVAYKEAETITINGVVYAPVAVAEKAAMPPIEADPAVETKADIPEVLAEDADMEAEAVGDDNMLNDAEIGAIAQAVISALMPHLDMEKKMSGYLTEMKTLLGGQMAQKDATVAELRSELETVKATVADLNGSQPRITAGGFRASQAGATVTNNETLKAAVPTADPVVQSFQGFMGDLGFAPGAGV